MHSSNLKLCFDICAQFVTRVETSLPYIDDPSQIVDGAYSRHQLL